MTGPVEIQYSDGCGGLPSDGCGGLPSDGCGGLPSDGCGGLPSDGCDGLPSIQWVSSKVVWFYDTCGELS